ncbi:uncharacterized protein B0H18DRAFT_1053461 [Fomitopsis serialis]|uniref:uncharacterized protein n=1 Tax=Fomitopsis serialis TaxID=139415 RepID=UPI002007C06E|nr:uncharacterized protein B0H18DRAFT_1053461 [Neoantrodia serialis]KAH9912509.1 hypothetical protein B0H18DRAFT_1053461 [Neoantrodia serialis]
MVNRHEVVRGYYSTPTFDVPNESHLLYSANGVLVVQLMAAQAGVTRCASEHLSRQVRAVSSTA